MKKKETTIKYPQVLRKTTKIGTQISQSEIFLKGLRAMIKDTKF